MDDFDIMQERINEAWLDFLSALASRRAQVGEMNRLELHAYCEVLGLINPLTRKPSGRALGAMLGMRDESARTARRWLAGQEPISAEATVRLDIELAVQTRIARMLWNRDDV